jgi:hypothetical protein
VTHTQVPSAKHPVADFGATGGDGWAAADLENFAREHGIRLMNNVPMEMSELFPFIQRGNLMLAGTWPNSNHHLVAITGYYVGSTGDTTMIRINYPDSMGYGNTSATDYPNMRLFGGEFAPYALIVP